MSELKSKIEQLYKSVLFRKLREKYMSLRKSAGEDLVKYELRPNQSIRDVADQYAASKGLTLQHGLQPVQVSPEHASRIAQAYHEMPHSPDHPEVASAYNALISEAGDQLAHMLKSGIKISKMKPGQPNPYPNSRAMLEDVGKNNHLWYYPTEQGYGQASAETQRHPMLAQTKFMDDEGKPMLANDVFRVVHDYFGHAKEGHLFGPSGEENAWRDHMQMFSPEAQKALTSETRGQNSWVNFGPHGEHNRANPSQTIYADQKAGIMPEWTSKPYEQIGKSENNKLHVKDILASRKSMERASIDNLRGSGSHSLGQPLHIWKLEDGRNLLVDGYHRLAHGISEGQESFPVEVVGSGYTDYHATPLPDDEFKGWNKTFDKSEESSEESVFKVAVVVLYDGNFILVGRRRKNEKWALPGGRFEDDEKKEDVVLRELYEEAGIKLSKDDLKYAGSKKIKNRQVYIFLAQYPGGETTLENDPDEEFTEWQWIRCEDGKAPDWLLEEEINPPTKAVFKKLGLSKAEPGLDETAAPLMNRQEDKFFLPASNVAEFCRVLKGKLEEGDIDTSTRYNVNRTTYLDNRDLDSFRDNMEKIRPRFKIRIRQYKPNGAEFEDVAYVEMKVKADDGYTKKFRVRIPASEVDSIAAGGEIKFDDSLPELNRDITRDVLWKRVANINSIITTCGFKKQVVVEYNRRAFSSGEIRVTVDDSLRYFDGRPVEADVLESITSSDNWDKMTKNVKKIMHKDLVIVEVKHEESTPAWLMSLIKDNGGKPVAFSKYFSAVTSMILRDKEEGSISRQKNYDANSIVREIVEGDVLGKSEELRKAPLQNPSYDVAQEKQTHDYTVFSADPEEYNLVHEESLPNGLKYRQYQHKRALPHMNKYVHTIYHPKYDDHIAMVETAHNYDESENEPYVNQVQWSEVHPLWRGKGLGRQAYLAALLYGHNMHEGLTSDSRVSKEAHGAWLSFKTIPGLGGKIGKYPKPGQLLFEPGRADDFENSLHHVFVRDEKKVPLDKIFSGTKDAYEPAPEKLAASEKVSMPKEEFIAEHKKLLDVLQNPTKEKLAEEFQEQSRELSELDKGLHGDWEKEGYTVKVSDENWNPIEGDYDYHSMPFNVTVHHPEGYEVGHAMVFHHPDGMMVSDVDVSEKHQRKGLANAMYRTAEELSGKKLVPYPVQHSPGKALWSQSNRPFGKAEPLEKPYRSEAQRRWAHTKTGTEALGGKEAVSHWDKETEGKDLPEYVEKNLDHHYLMWPVTINNENSDPVTGQRYHITLRHVGEHAPNLDFLNHHFQDIGHLVPDKFELQPHIFNTPNGIVHVLRLNKYPDWMKQVHSSLDQPMGPDKFFSYIPHITVPKHMYDRFISDPASVKVKTGPLQLWKGNDTLWQAPTRLAASEDEIFDLIKAKFATGDKKKAVNSKSFDERMDMALRELAEGKVSSENRPYASVFSTGEKPRKTTFGAQPHTLYSYGPHWPMVKILDHNTLVVNAHPYGGVTENMLRSLANIIPEHFPEYNIIEVHHPDYKTSANIMRGTHDDLINYLKQASTQHQDPSVRDHSVNALAYLNKLNKARPDKREAHVGFDPDKTVQTRLKRLNDYLEGIGLIAIPHMTEEDPHKMLGAGGTPTKLTSTPGHGPVEQQLVHEAAHALQTPTGMTLGEYQRAIGEPGQRLYDKNLLGSMPPEYVAQMAEAGISRRAGMAPFRTRPGYKSPESMLGRAFEAAREKQKRIDLGLERFDPQTGRMEEQLTPHAAINLRAMGKPEEAQERMKRRYMRMLERQGKLAASDITESDLRKAEQLSFMHILDPILTVKNPEATAEQMHNAIVDLENQGWTDSVLNGARARAMNHPNTSDEDRLGLLKRLYATDPTDVAHVGHGYANYSMSDDQKRKLLSDFLASDEMKDDKVKNDFMSRLLRANDEGLIPVDVMKDHLEQAVNKMHPDNKDRRELERTAFKHGLDISPKIDFKLGSNKLREVRDLAESSPDRKVHKSTLEQLGMKPSDLGIQKLQDGKGFISADKVQQQIDAIPSLRYGFAHTTYGDGTDKLYGENQEWRDSDEYNSAYDEHMDEFDPEDYGVYRRDYVDDYAAREAHADKFDPDDVDRSDYSDDDEGQEEYQEALDRARDRHNDKFDIDDWVDDDTYLDERAYRKATEKAEDKHREKFEFDPSEHGWKKLDEALDDAAGEQRHNHLNSKVFQLNVTNDQLNKMKEAGVYDTFKRMIEASYASSHPVEHGKTIGWLRYTEHPDGIHIDEVQSDLGQSFARQAAAHAKRAVENGEMTEEQARERVSNIEKLYPEHDFKKISDIAFAGKDPNELIHEAFLQHHRNTGDIGKKVMIWKANPKAKISGQETGESFLTPRSVKRIADDIQEGQFDSKNIEHVVVKQLMDQLGVRKAEDLMELHYLPKIIPRHTSYAKELDQQVGPRVPDDPRNDLVRASRAEKIAGYANQLYKAGAGGMTVEFQDPNVKLPAHMQRTYDQQPRKMGYKQDGQYGQISGQDNPNYKGREMNQMTLRKKEDSLYLDEKKGIL